MREAGPYARWSLDGKSIYFVEGRQVWVMDEDGGDARPLWKPPQPPVTLAALPSTQIYTNDAGSLVPGLSHDASKTSALEMGQAAALSQGIGIGM